MKRYVIIHNLGTLFNLNNQLKTPGPVAPGFFSELYNSFALLNKLLRILPINNNKSCLTSSHIWN